MELSSNFNRKLIWINKDLTREIGKILLIFFAFKILIVLQHAGQFAKPLCMRLLYPCDLVERGCHFYEAFFFGYISEVLVHILILFHLVMLAGKGGQADE